MNPAALPSRAMSPAPVAPASTGWHDRRNGGLLAISLTDWPGWRNTTSRQRSLRSLAKTGMCAKCWMVAHQFSPFLDQPAHTVVVLTPVLR